MTDETQETTDTSTQDDTGSVIADAVASHTPDDNADDKPAVDTPDDKPSDDAGDDKDAKPDDKDDAPSGAPDTYDTEAFKMPEGVEFDAEGFEAIEPVLREMNMSQNDAGKLMEGFASKIVPMIEARQQTKIDEMGEQLKADMGKELKADPEVGGAQLEESQALTARAIHQYLPDAGEREQFTKFLSETGMGNNRFLMRVLTGAGRELGETETPAAHAAGGTKTTTEKFYPS